MSKRRYAIGFLLFGVIPIALLGMGQGCGDHEHPGEHPSEHPEGGESAALTKDVLADAVAAYVEKTAAEQGGRFTVVDDKTGEQLELTLDKVHRDRLSRVGPDLYFACADFKTPTGKVYDLDVFMEGTAVDNLTFSKFDVHKEEGKERYTWYEEGGVWKTKQVGGGAEHPAEHPAKEESAEHPKKAEHPTKEQPKKAEHPEHPS